MYLFKYITLLIISCRRLRPIVIIPTNVYVGLETVILDDIVLARMRHIDELVLDCLFFQGNVVVEPAIVDCAGAETVLCLVEVLLVDIDLGDLKKSNHSDVI